MIVLCKVTLRAMACKLVFNGILLWTISCLMRMEVPPDALLPSGPFFKVGVSLGLKYVSCRQKASGLYLRKFPLESLVH